MNIRGLLYLFIMLIGFVGFVYSQDTITNQLSQEELNIALILAADTGNSDAVLDLLKKGAEVNAKTSDGVTALMFAAQKGHLKTVRVLAANGADVNATPFTRETALFAAVKNNHEEVVHYLLIKGADPSIKNTSGNNPLHYAVLYNYYVIADMLLFYKSDIDAKAWNDITPLMIAVYYQNLPITKLLLEKGANVNAVDVYYYTPLMLAAQNGDFEIVKLLVENKALINKKNSYGNTPLDIAIKNGDDEIVTYLLENDTLGSEKDKDYTKAYKIAVINNQKNIADTLLKKGAKGKYSPFFSKLFFSYGPNLNLKSFLVETKVGIIESKYKLSFDVGISNHYWPKRVLLEEEEGVFAQMWEKRSLLFCDFDKRINFSSSPKNQKGMFIGVRTAYTFGNYNGTNMKIDDKILYSPQIGLFTMSNYVAAKINYEYVDFGVIGIPKHRVNFSFMFYVNLFKQKNTKRELNFY